MIFYFNRYWQISIAQEYLEFEFEFKSRDIKVAMTGTTGMAASLIGGVTLHKFLSITN